MTSNTKPWTTVGTFEELDRLLTHHTSEDLIANLSGDWEPDKANRTANGSAVER